MKVGTEVARGRWRDTSLTRTILGNRSSPTAGLSFSEPIEAMRLGSVIVFHAVAYSTSDRIDCVENLKSDFKKMWGERNVQNCGCRQACASGK